MQLSTIGKKKEGREGGVYYRVYSEFTERRRRNKLDLSLQWNLNLQPGAVRLLF